MITTSLPQTYRVLLVDDSETDLEIYKRLLSKNSSDFITAEAMNAIEAKNQIENNDFDCCVVDYQLPDISGLDLVKFMTEQAVEGKSFAIIMVTGHGSEEIAVESLKAGADDYLTKKSITDGFFVRPIINNIHKKRLSKELELYQKKLEHSNRELTEFAHTASHDLKSPLRRVASYIDILKEDAAERLTGEDKKIIDRMAVNTKRMQTLINDLLTFSLINYEEEKKEVTDLDNIVQEIIDEMKPQIEECGAVIEYDKLTKLKVSPTRIRQVFTNLISNALKYRRDETPRISIRLRENNKTYEFVVEDNGQGIPKDMLPDIFKDFKRLHANEDIEGTGLGLSICRRIVEQHGGKIWVESEEGKGSSFYFNLPAEE
jgi:signal transduction histidine kinase